MANLKRQPLRCISALLLILILFQWSCTLAWETIRTGGEKKLTFLSQSRRRDFTQRWRSDDDAPSFKFFILGQEASGQIAPAFWPFLRCQLALVICSFEGY